MQKITKQVLVEWLINTISAKTGLNAESINIHDELITFNIDSIQTGVMLYELEKLVNLELGPLIFWNNPTIDKLADYLLLEMEKQKA